jgi:hypothetical protein
LDSGAGEAGEVAGLLSVGALGACVAGAGDEDAAEAGAEADDAGEAAAGGEEAGTDDDVADEAGAGDAVCAGLAALYGHGASLGTPGR